MFTSLFVVALVSLAFGSTQLPDQDWDLIVAVAEYATIAREAAQGNESVGGELHDEAQMLVALTADILDRGNPDELEALARLSGQRQLMVLQIARIEAADKSEKAALLWMASEGDLLMQGHALFWDSMFYTLVEHRTDSMEERVAVMVAAREAAAANLAAR